MFQKISREYTKQTGMEIKAVLLRTGRCAWPSFAARWRIDRTFGGQNWLHVRHGCKRSVSLRLFAKF